MTVMLEPSLASGEASLEMHLWEGFFFAVGLLFVLPIEARLQRHANLYVKILLCNIVSIFGAQELFYTDLLRGFKGDSSIKEKERRN